LVVVADTVIDPGAVMVHPCDAPLAYRAVMGRRRLQTVAFLAFVAQHTLQKAKVTAYLRWMLHVCWWLGCDDGFNFKLLQHIGHGLDLHFFLFSFLFLRYFDLLCHLIGHLFGLDLFGQFLCRALSVSVQFDLIDPELSLDSDNSVLELLRHGVEVKFIVILGQHSRLCGHALDMAPVYHETVVLEDNQVNVRFPTASQKVFPEGSPDEADHHHVDSEVSYKAGNDPGALNHAPHY